MEKTSHVKIYYKPDCSYSIKALQLLDSKKNINIEKIDISNNMQLRDEMIKYTNRTTVPQIFINGEHIGGCDDLLMLESSSNLDKKLYT